MPKLTQDRVLGLVALALGLFIALYWASADSETGIIEKLRGRSSIGDAMAPTVAAVLLSFAGLWLVIIGQSGSFNRRNATYLGVVLVILFCSLGVMRWGGPALVELLIGTEYRPQRDTVPWKYFGFVLGGTALITALIYMVERELRPSRILIAFGVTAVLAFLYDVPFDDLLLPPNGDV
ncbi:MAG: hypothetical protein AAF439_03710 [Pseudomonadota bacterium]